MYHINISDLFKTSGKLDVVSELMAYALLCSLNGKTSEKAEDVVLLSSKSVQLKTQISRLDKLKKSQKLSEMKECLGHPVLLVAKYLVLSNSQCYEHAVSKLVQKKKSEVHDKDTLISNFLTVL